MSRTPELYPRTTPGARVEALAPGHWRLEIPAGPAGHYRWAQLDDYLHRRRAAFPWRPPVCLSLRARASHPALTGTWGFGLWNDPFAAGLLGGAARRLPALPNAAWFFYASPPNHLALHDGHAADGFLAAAFASPPVPSPALALALPALPFLAWPAAARRLRRLAGHWIRDDAARLEADVTVWHTYALEWRAGEVRFLVDGAVRFVSPLAPCPPLGLVLWIDNQYAAFPPTGRLGFGTLPNPQPAWLELAQVAMHPL